MVFLVKCEQVRALDLKLEKASVKLRDTGIVVREFGDPFHGIKVNGGINGRFRRVTLYGAFGGVCS